jgi:hypothetical protein
MASFLPSITVIRKLNRDRVKEFEDEMKGKIQILDEIEKDMKETGHYRQEWLKNISQTFYSESDVHNRMIGVIKAQSELSALKLRLDLLRLDAQYDTHKLNLLIEATRPLDNKETPESRDLLLHRKARNNSDLLKVALENSLDFRLKLIDHNHELLVTLRKVKAQAEAELKVQADDVKRKLEVYKNRMKHSAEKSLKVYTTILREYLVLRHNAHVAEEILQRSQSDANRARIELKSCLERVLQEATSQKEQVLSGAEREISVQTADMRVEVMKKERELEELMTRVKRLQQHKKGQFIELQEELHHYNKQYATLQKKRREDLVKVHTELNLLKQMIQNKQDQLHFQQYSPRGVAEATMELQRLKMMFDHLLVSFETDDKDK